MLLEAANGLGVDVSDGGTVRIGWGEPDWFGPGSATQPPSGSPAGSTGWADDLGEAHAVVVVDGPVRCSVRAYDDRPMLVFRSEATTDLSGLATGAFDQPSVGWPVFTPAERLAGGVPEGTRAVVFQHCEFGLPSQAGADLDGFFLLPHRPPTGWPLLLAAPDGRTILVAPIDSFHEQAIGLNGGTVRCGWHGDLERVDAGFATELLVLAGDGPRACLDEWGRLLLERAGTVRPGRWPDALGSRPSYWTDNGAAYWYRTEPGHDAGRLGRRRGRRPARAGRPARQRAARLVVLPPRRPAAVRHRRVGRAAVGDGGLGGASRRPARRHRRPREPASATRPWSPTSVTSRPTRRSPARCRW